LGEGFGQRTDDEDVEAFLARWSAGDPSADFCGVGFGPSGPDGLITPWDIDGFIGAYNQAVAEGRHLDPLPNFGPQGEGSPEPGASAFSPETLSDAPAQILEPTRPLATSESLLATPALDEYPIPLSAEVGILVMAPQATSSEGSAFLASRGTSEADEPPLHFLMPTGTPLAWSTAAEVAPPPDAVLSPDGGVESLLLVPALEIPMR